MRGRYVYIHILRESKKGKKRYKTPLVVERKEEGVM